MERTYQDYHRLMYAQALRVLKSAPSAEDAVSEALLALMKKISLLRTLDGNKLRSYCVITVKHTAISMLRRNRRETPEDFQAEAPAPDRTEGRVLEQAGVERVKDAIRCLPPQEMRIMLMRYFREMTEEEIGRELGLQPVSVRVHLSRARKKLKQLLMDKEATL